MAHRIALKEFDWLIVAAALLITAIGITFIWSTSDTPDAASTYIPRQLVWVGIAILLAGALLTFSYQRLGRYAFVIYAVGILSLVAVFFFSPRRHATRWIHLWGGLSFQPSEFAKIALVITLAQFLRYRNAASLKTLALAGVIVAVPMILVLKQPDLGTALTMMPIAVAMLFVAGMRMKHAAVIALVGVLLLPVGWFMLKGYQKDRVLAFLRPEEKRLSEGYQAIQSVVATGSGRMFGRGLGQGKVRVPESTTDFIFAAVGEEWGFAGCSFLLLLFMLMFASSLGIAARTREPFGRLLVVGCTATIAIQTLINTAMTVRFMPVTGLTLPLMSYGGSSLVSCYAALALILNVGMRRVDVLDSENIGA